MASSICSLRRVLLHPSSTRVNSLPSMFSRRGHVASSQGSISSDVAAKGSKRGDDVAPEDKRADMKTRPINVWAPDPVTGYYRPIDEATEARENAMRNKK